MIYGYLRVSTKDKQEFTRQEFALKEYHIDKIFEEKISGTKKASTRPEFEKLLSEVVAGDTIYFESMSRMARSMNDLITTTNLLANKMKVKVIFLKENIIVGGNGMDAMTGLIFNIMGAFAQFERDMISDRTKQGLQAKRELGIVGGRRKTTNSDLEAKVREKYRNREKLGITSNDIMAEFGLGKTVFYRIVKGEK